jgi:hypothetical protein
VFAFALVLNEKCRRLGLLEWRWLEIFIAPTTFIVVAVNGTRDSSVVHWTWHCSLSGACHVSRPLGLERLTVEVSCPFVAPDSPVCSDFVVLTSALCSMHCSP